MSLQTIGREAELQTALPDARRPDASMLDPEFVSLLQKFLGVPVTGVLDPTTIEALQRRIAESSGASGDGSAVGAGGGGGGGGGGATAAQGGGSAAPLGFEDLIDRVLLDGGQKRQQREAAAKLGQFMQGMMKAPGMTSGGRINTGGQTLRSEAARRGIDPSMDRNRAGATGITPNPGPQRPGMQGLLDEIAEGEGTSDATARQHGYNSGYDVTLGYGAYTPGRGDSRPLTDMTLGEVKALQRNMLRHPNNGHNSSAVGRYQIVGTTLRGLQRQMGLSDSARFTPELQDRMAEQLLERRGLSAYQSGRISASTFQNRLSQEWASVATSGTGRSYYGQATGTTSSEILAAIAGVRDRYANVA